MYQIVMSEKVVNIYAIRSIEVNTRILEIAGEFSLYKTSS